MTPKKVDTGKSIQNNYFPITSAIAVKDYNKSSSTQKQVLVMTEQSVGGSAGLRNKANIEVMHQRRYKGKSLNETDE
jgi:hypothetical protein